jgi:Flp pilus assembly protein TadG
MENAMRVVTSLSGLVTRFLRHRQGNFGMMMAMVAPVLLLAAGYAVNIGQITLTKSNLLAALDSAVTSTARDLTTGVISEDEAPKVVEAFLSANGLRAYAEKGRLKLDELIIDKTAKTVSAKASVELDVAFALFGAANLQKITAESAALYSDRKVDVAMMLDITGSMRGQRIIDLRNAAANAVQILLSNNRAGWERVRIALVPYADSVNAGVLSHTVYKEQDRRSSIEGPALPRAQQVAASNGNVCSTEREGVATRLTDDGPDVQMVNRDYRLTFCSVSTLIPLTHDKNRLTTHIKSLIADPYAWTNGRVGIQWSWYLLSPNWSKVLPAENRPLPYAAENTSKFAILMTDGEFNLGFDEVPNGEDFRNQTPRNWKNSELLCAEMKKKGIRIFSIGFHLSSAAEDVMRKCATPDSGGTKHFYAASSGAELDNAFKSIARNIEGLALTK